MTVPATAKAAKPGAQEYSVKLGDTLSKLADRFFTTRRTNGKRFTKRTKMPEKPTLHLRQAKTNDSG